MYLIYTTLSNKDQAKTLAKALLEKKLIACANILPSTSIYTWEEELKEEEEVVLICKTTKDITKDIKQLHPYKTPCILKIQAEANKEFLEWTKKTTKHQ